MKKMIVTGATCMIGVALIKEAIKNNVEIFAVVRPETRRISRLPESDFVHIVKSDLAHLNALDFITLDCDVFYHFAWEGTGKEERDNPLIQERNIQYTFDAVELAHRCGCRKFIGAGSQAEYGQTENVINEKTRHDPVTAYGIGKYAAGLMSRKLCDRYGMVHIWGRVFSVYGCYDNEDTMINYAIKQFMKREPAKFSSAAQTWTYLFESDAGRIFYCFGCSCGLSGNFLVASEEQRPLREYILKIAQYMSAEDLVIFGADSDVYDLKADVSSLKKACNLSSFISFDEGIKAVIDSYLNQRSSD